MAAITEAGFVRPTYAELLQAQETRAKGVFGEDADTGENSVLGKFIRLLVYDLALLYEDLEGAYFARFPHYASGVNLDRLMPFAGIVRNPAVAAAHTVRFYGPAGGTVPGGFLLATGKGVLFRTEQAYMLGDEGHVDARVVCTETGHAGNVPTGSITREVNPTGAVARVEHTGPQLVQGREWESDAELRVRFSQSIAGIGSATADAIQAAVLRVPKVLGCMVKENDSDEERDGLPPHSFETFVLTEEASFADIGAAIFSKKPMGIASRGTQEVEVPDSAGRMHTVRFSRVEELPLAVRMEVCVSNLFPKDGEGDIAEALCTHINQSANGRDFVFASLYPVIYSIAGVEDVRELAVAQGVDGAFGTDNIEVGAGQAVRLASANVDIVVKSYEDK